MGNLMSECHSLINKVAHSLIGLMTLRPLSFLSEWVLIRSCGRVALRLSLQQWTVISLQWKSIRVGRGQFITFESGPKKEITGNWIILRLYNIFILHKLLCIHFYENGSLQSVGWSERKQNPCCMCFDQYKRQSVLCWTGTPIYILDCRPVISVFLGRMTNLPPTHTCKN